MLISCPFSHRKGIIKEVFLKTVTTFGAQDKKVCTDYFWWDRGILSSIKPKYDEWLLLRL